MGTSFRKKIIALVCVFGFVLVFMVSFISYSRHEKQMVILTGNQTQQIIEQLGTNIDSYVDELFRLTLAPYYNDEVLEALEHEGTTAGERLVNRRKIENFLSSVMILPRDEILRVYLISENDIYSYIRTPYEMEDYEAYQDTEWYAEAQESIHARSRDNARTPMQWDDSENAGFTTGIPWIRITPNYKEVNAKAQESDSDSVFHFYRQLIDLRKRYEVFVTGKFELLLPEDEHIFAYIRTCAEQRLMVIANFGKEIQTFDLEDIDEKHTRLLLSNEVNRKPGILGSYEARMYLSCENDKE